MSSAKLFLSEKKAFALLGSKKFLSAFLWKIFGQEQVIINSLSIILCSDEELLKINREFLKHNYYTDIITFNLNTGEPVIGELYISEERIKENAVTYKASVSQELLRVIIHGILHLCNYKDNTKPSKRTMTEKEDFYLSLYSKCST